MEFENSELLALELEETNIEVLEIEGTVVARKPVITVQPVGGSISEGSSLTLSIEADGLGSTLSYQWYLDGGAISEATSSSYVFTASGIGDNALYCKVNGFSGAVNSETVHVITEANGSHHSLTVGHKSTALYDIWGFLSDGEGLGDFQPRLTDSGDECNYLGVTAYIDGTSIGSISFLGTYQAGQITIDIEGLDTIIGTTIVNEDIFGTGSYGCVFDSTTTDRFLAFLTANSGSVLSVNIQFIPS